VAYFFASFLETKISKEQEANWDFGGYRNISN